MARETESARRNLVKVTIPIDDLPCGSSLAIERQLADLPGVAQAYVNPLTEMAYVAFDPITCGVERIRSAIRELGFCPGEPQVRDLPRSDTRSSLSHQPWRTRS